MQLHSADKNTVQTNVGNSREFTIKASGKAFEILSANLYKDKIGAPIRELACNALDAHAMAKNKDPIVVHLPTTFEPYFSVEDKGTGMTPDQIEDLYTSYFSSSKEHSNNQIGALGLGSKSPFAYTDTFSVDSVCEGVHTSYSAVIAKNGTPTIMTLNSKPSDAHPGVKITFPVKEQDFRTFVNRAVHIFWAFDKKPTFIGAVKTYEEYVRSDKSSTIYEGRGWKFYKEYPSWWNGTSNSLIKMGNILYPFNPPGDIRSKLATNYGLYLDNKFIIEMKLGECDIAPSREELSYDELTVSNIERRLQIINADFDEKLRKTLDESPSEWVAAQKAFEFYNSFGSRNSYKDKIVTYPFTYKGANYKYGEAFKVAFPESYTQITPFRRRRVATSLTAIAIVAGQVELKLGSNVFIILEPRKVIDWNSANTRKRVGKYITNNKVSTSGLVIYAMRSLPESLRKQLHGIPVVNYDDLPKNPNNNYVSKKLRASSTKIRVTNWESGPGPICEEESSELSQDKKIFIISKAKKYYVDWEALEDANANADLKTCQYLRKPLNAFGISLAKVYVVTSLEFKRTRLDLSTDWISFKDFIAQNLKVLDDKYKESYIARTKNHILNNFYSRLLNQKDSAIQYIKRGVGPDSDFTKKYDQIALLGKIDKMTEQYGELKKCVTAHNLVPYTITSNTIVEKDTIGMYAKYPMLKVMLEVIRYESDLGSGTLQVLVTEKNTSNIKYLDLVVDYIKMVDTRVVSE